MSSEIMQTAAFFLLKLYNSEDGMSWKGIFKIKIVYIFFDVHPFLAGRFTRKS